MAKKLNIAPSTVSRELHRNTSTSDQYDPNTAQNHALKRCLQSKPKRICENTKTAVEFMLMLDWSPEQISDICVRIGYPVSQEWIYQYILNENDRGGSLITHLRRKLKRLKKVT